MKHEFRRAIAIARDLERAHENGTLERELESYVTSIYDSLVGLYLTFWTPEGFRLELLAGDRTLVLRELATNRQMIIPMIRKLAQPIREWAEDFYEKNK